MCKMLYFLFGIWCNGLTTKSLVSATIQLTLLVHFTLPLHLFHLVTSALFQGSPDSLAWFVCLFLFCFLVCFYIPYMSEIMLYLFFPIWHLIYHKISRSIHVVVSGKISLLWLSSISLHTHTHTHTHTSHISIHHLLMALRLFLYLDYCK